MFVYPLTFLIYAQCKMESILALAASGGGGLASMLGGGGSGSDPNVEKFNNLLLEFLTKLKRSAKFSKVTSDRINQIINMAAEDSTIPIGLFKGVADNKEQRGLLEGRNEEIFDKLTIVEKKEFQDLSTKTQNASWKYVGKLTRIADRYQPSALANAKAGAAGALGGLDVETITNKAFSALSAIKGVFEKRGVTEKAFVDTVGEICDELPDMGSVRPKAYTDKAKKWTRKILFSDEFDEKNKKQKIEKIREAIGNVDPSSLIS